MAATAAVVAAVHGILTPGTTSNWAREFQVWADARLPEVAVVTDHYYMGPFPRINWLRNRALARRHANLVMPWAARGKKVFFVAHSNGAAVAMQAVEILARAGVKTEGVVLVAGAVSSDVRRSGVVGLQERGMLGRAVSFWSAEDVLGRVPALFYWPYGRLASRGWTDGGEAYWDREVFSVEHRGFGHTDYWAEGNREETFVRVWDCLAGDGAGERRWS